jgi:hypothetical protein
VSVKSFLCHKNQHLFFCLSVCPLSSHRSALLPFRLDIPPCPHAASRATEYPLIHLLSFFSSFSGWGETESTWYVGHCWPIVSAPDDRCWLWSSWWNEDWQGKPKYSEKTRPSATLSTTNPTWPDVGSNPGRRGGKPATNRLSYGTAHWSI